MMTPLHPSSQQGSNGVRFVMGTLLFIFLALPIASARPPRALNLFKQANAAYGGGDYEKAIELYQTLLEQEEEDASIYYNLGNASFKQKNLGRAIFYYEKAKRLLPRDRDLNANLDYVQSLLEYRIEDRRSWYFKALEGFLASFTFQEIGVFSLGLGVFFWGGWFFSLYFRGGGSWGWKRKALLLMLMIGLSLWAFKGLHRATVEEAIVLKSKAPVRYGPSFKDQVAIRLGEGMKVRVKRKSREWRRVALPNQETGWMYEEDLGVI